jgi:hypothetical protein
MPRGVPPLPGVPVPPVEGGSASGREMQNSEKSTVQTQLRPGLELNRQPR